MTTPLVRIPLTLVAALAFHISMSPPTSSPPSMLISSSTPGNDRHAKICAAARFITAMTTKGFYWASALTDTALLLAKYFPTSLPIFVPPKAPHLSWLRTLAPGLNLNLSLSLLTSLFPPMPLLPLRTVAGTSLVITGAFLRRRAYVSLGQFYTCPNGGPNPCTRGGTHHAHALITTGPYAFVRHPGYTGLILTTTGLVILHLDVLGLYLGDSSGGTERVSSAMRTVVLACALLGSIGALRRIRDEERGLRAQFKGEWEAWAEKVQYMLVPGVY